MCLAMASHGTARAKQTDAPVADVGKRLMDVERAISQAKRRLTDAATLLVDGALDRAGYEGLHDKVTAELSAAEVERDRLQGIQPAAKLPPLETVLEQVGGWSDAHVTPIPRTNATCWTC